MRVGEREMRGTRATGGERGGKKEKRRKGEERWREERCRVTEQLRTKPLHSC